ncbi:P-type conjugative transfer ATPase TrbB [Rhizobium mesosinicum]|uniref:P-type conjugative transfer ATPase TrbB n=1 Tax=Rhizobium mesosinicum TaxID=335017 RepID=A0ABS7GX93_9HYPH|nr:P-type conjugative transfer ATPase TrbB [Rhizobium mesosinicum]MBW9054607.1 P-type conjugative transfer ATPase TrbB [Rhizobium mesosinicum]
MQARSLPRLVRKLEDALGPSLLTALADPSVSEIMLNPDGCLFIERLGAGIVRAGEMEEGSAEIIIGVVAHVLNTEVDTARPIVSGELPIGGHRFEGLLPPIVSGPAFSIRRHASQLIALDDYVTSRIMTARQARILRDAVGARLNVVVSGGTGSGKTTLSNAIIAEIANHCPNDRLIILEDTSELQCAAANVLSLRTSDEVDMAQLLKSTMRLRPDRIIVGEVRDGAALTLLKAWNTGHPGGVTTLHANSAHSALVRLEQLTAEASRQPMQAVIGEAVDLVVSIERTPQGRRITDILQVNGFSGGAYHLEPDVEGRHAA